MAHARLGAVLGNLGLGADSSEHSSIAYQLRHRVSQAESFYISGQYHSDVSGDEQKLVENYELWRDLYPRAVVPVTNLAAHYNWTGQPEKAVLAAERAVELGPDLAWPYRELTVAYAQVGRFDDAQHVLDEAFSKGFELFALYRIAYHLAYLEGDEEGMRALIESQSGRPTGARLLRDEAAVAASGGELARATRLVRQAAEEMLEHDLDVSAAGFLLSGALWRAQFGDAAGAKALVAEAEEVMPGASWLGTAMALAAAGASEEALAVVDEGQANGIPVVMAFAQTVRGAAALSQGDPSGALAALEAMSPYERSQPIAIFLRGRAYLGASDGTAAVAEFEKLRQVRGVQAVEPFHVLGRLGLARALALAGDTEASKEAYEEFLSLVREADEGLSLVEAAQRELAELK